MKKFTVLIIVAVLLVGLAAGCSSMSPLLGNEDYYSEGSYSSPEYETAAEDVAYDKGEYDTLQEAPAAEEPADGGSSFQNAAGPDYEGSLLQPGVDRKIIYSGEMVIQTTSYEEDIKRILSALIETGGYMESQSTSGEKPEQWNDPGRTARFTLRVPSKNFDAFIEKLKGYGETKYISTYGQDVSLQYFDTETKLKTLRIREERLIGLLEEAKGLEDIIKLEQELANVSYDIQMHEINLRNYDSLIEYSTISIELREVNEVERVTASKQDLGTRISTGFYSVLNVLAEIGEGLLIFLVAGSPVLIALAVIAVVVILLIRRSRKKKAQKTNGGV